MNWFILMPSVNRDLFLDNVEVYYLPRCFNNKEGYFCLVKNTLKWICKKSHIFFWYKIQKMEKNIYDVDKKSERSFETCCRPIFWNECPYPLKFQFNCNNCHVIRVIFLPHDVWQGVYSNATKPYVSHVVIMIYYYLVCFIYSL